MSKYLQTLYSYFKDFDKLKEPVEIFSYWKNAPVLSSQDLVDWIEKQFIEKSNYQLSIEYEIADEYNWQPDYFKVITKVVEEEFFNLKKQPEHVSSNEAFKSSIFFKQSKECFDNLSEEEKEKKIKEINTRLEKFRIATKKSHPELFMPHKNYINSFEEREKLIHDFKSLENILQRKIQFNVAFIVDNENYKRYFEDIFLSGSIQIRDEKCFDAMFYLHEFKLDEHYLIENSAYERGLIKIDLKIFGVRNQLFNWAFDLFPKLVFDSKGVLIKEWNKKHIEGWSKSR